MKRSGLEFRRTEMAFRIVGSTDAFPRNPHKVGVQFAVGILVVEDGNGIGSLSDVWKLADSVPA